MKTIKTILVILLALITTTLSAQSKLVSIKDVVFLNDTINLNEILVTGSYTAVKETPFSFTNLSSTTLQLRQGDTEPAVLLVNTPSVTYYTDNGLGYGYMYYRIRGIDQSRINATYNGVPMNEPEDQGIYFNNYFNFLGSIDNVQIIRGAGLTKSGVSSYGGSINFNSELFPDKFSVNSQITQGSYGTFGINGGVSSENFFINGSYGKTDGYRYNSFNDSYSTFYGFKIKDDIKVYGFVGKQKNGMAWIGEPLDSINVDPRYNSNKANETDNFLYIHNQLHWDIGAFKNFKTIFYHTYLTGWYDTDIAHFDPSLQWGDLMNRIFLKSNWLGTVLNYNLKNENINTNFGVSAYTYYRDHVGSYNGEEAYTNTGNRNEVAPYIKGEIKTKKFSIYGDVQYRYSVFSYEGLTEFPTQTYNFLNWSGGITYRSGVNSTVYYGIGRTNREPTRTDLFMGWDDFDPASYNPTVPETALDNEIGFKYIKDGIKVNTNVYYMKFKNEIVLNGQVGPNSVLLHQNVDNSFRSGLEIDGSYIMNNGFEFILIGSFSYNRIKEANETFSPVLTPSVIISSDVKYNLKNWFYVGLNVQYNGESYIDFANDNILPDYLILNAYSGLKFKGLELQANLNNLTNQLVLRNAVMGYDGNPLYFVMADMNGLATLKYKF